MIVHFARRFVVQNAQPPTIILRKCTYRLILKTQNQGAKHKPRKFFSEISLINSFFAKPGEFFTFLLYCFFNADIINI